MLKPNFNTYYFTAVLIGLAVGIFTEDKPVGILVTIALLLTVAELKKRYNNRRK